MTISFDTETSLFQPGQMAPSMICMSHAKRDYTLPSVCSIDGSPLTRETMATGLLHANDAKCESAFQKWLEGDETLVGQNVEFDMAVIASKFPHLLPRIFDKYKRGQVSDTLIREQLLDIAAGRFGGEVDERGVFKKRNYSLAEIAYRRLGVILDKDEWRMRYAEFKDMPVAQWPEGAKKYAIDDAVTTLRVWEQQEASRFSEFPGLGRRDVLKNEGFQTYASFCAHLASCWGLRTSAEGVANLLSQTKQKYLDLEAFLKERGLIRQNGVRDTKKVQSLLFDAWKKSDDEIEGIARTLAEKATDKAMGLEWQVGDTVAAYETRLTEGRKDPLWLEAYAGALAIERKAAHPEYLRRGARKTPTGLLAADEESCAVTEDPVLVAYAEYGTLKAIMSKDVPMLEAGLIMPVHTRFRLVETGRYSSSKPNVQNIRRTPGIRESFVPREGKVYLQADFEGLELRTLAEYCYATFGVSKLREALNTGLDPHLMVASSILGKPYDWCVEHKKAKEVDDARQIGKVANFGMPGGIGAARLCDFAQATYKVTISESFAKSLKRTWLAEFPEMVRFLEHIAKLQKDGVPIMLPYSERIRSTPSYTAACNTCFQGLGSDVAKSALQRVSEACYVLEESPLFGSRIVNFIHDELILETDPTNLQAKGEELERLMIEGAKVFLPNLNVSAPAVAMAYWSKKAKAVHDKNGDLAVWDGSEAA